MEHVPRFAAEHDGGAVICELCPRQCSIPNGLFGACKVRGNKNGKGILPFYGFITALAVDPIEKKPLYHFRPGTEILSAGFAGCNLYCPFCQNWRISQSTESPGRYMPPEEIISAAMHGNSQAIAYTYSEPLVHAEYLLDCMALARRHGIANVLVTNGCVNAAPAGEILSLADAANIDLKCFSGETYRKTLGGDLDTVLAFIRLAMQKNVHVEITTLIVPGLNDNEDELENCINFIDKNIPWHLSAYHPEYRWNAPPTDPRFLVHIREIAAKKIDNVYTGNVRGEENDTFCGNCKSLLVRRRGYQVTLPGLAEPACGEKHYRCKQCRKETSIVF